MAVQLTAATGRAPGSRAANRLRREGQIPGVVYGLGAEPVPVSVEWPELRRALTTDAGLNALIDLDVGGTTSLSIVKDLQRHPVRRDVLHVDFLRLDPDADIQVDVPLLLVGDAEKVTRGNGIVDQALHTLPIHVRPADIPGSLSVDISELEVGTVVTVGDVALPEGVRTDLDPEEPVASAYVPRRVAALLAAEAAGGEIGEDGELIVAEGDEGEGGEASGDGDGDGADAGDEG